MRFLSFEFYLKNVFFFFVYYINENIRSFLLHESKNDMEYFVFIQAFKQYQNVKDNW